MYRKIEDITLRDKKLGLYLKLGILLLFITLTFTVTYYYSFTYIIPIALMLLFKVSPSKIYKVTLVFITCLLTPSILTYGLINGVFYLLDIVLSETNKLLLSFTSTALMLLTICFIKGLNRTAKKILYLLINEKRTDMYGDYRLLNYLLNVSIIRIFYYTTYFIYSVTITYFTLFHINDGNFKLLSSFSYSFTMFFAYDRVLRELWFYDPKHFIKIIKKEA